MNPDPVEGSKVTIKSQDNDKAQITLAGFAITMGMGEMKLEDIVIADVKVTSAENNSSVLSGNIDTTSGGVNITGEIKGVITKDEAKITFSIKPGKMPHTITAVFEGKK